MYNAVLHCHAFAHIYINKARGCGLTRKPYLPKINQSMHKLIANHQFESLPHGCRIPQGLTQPGWFIIGSLRIVPVPLRSFFISRGDTNRRGVASSHAWYRLRLKVVWLVVTLQIREQLQHFTSHFQTHKFPQRLHKRVGLSNELFAQWTKCEALQGWISTSCDQIHKELGGSWPLNELGRKSKLEARLVWQ